MIREDGKKMKDVTSTSFGLLIAFLLPGFAGFCSLSFYSYQIRNTLDKFWEANSDVGAFLLVLLLSLIIGLLVTQIRWVMFEIGLCRNVHLDLASKAELRIETKFVAFRAAVDETYRYHQFFGGMAVVMPIFYIGWVRESWLALTRYKFGLTLVLFTASKS